MELQYHGGLNPQESTALTLAAGIHVPVPRCRLLPRWHRVACLSHERFELSDVGWRLFGRGCSILSHVFGTHLKWHHQNPLVGWITSRLT